MNFSSKNGKVIKRYMSMEKIFGELELLKAVKQKGRNMKQMQIISRFIDLNEIKVMWSQFWVNKRDKGNAD